MKLHGLPPLVSKDTRVLILGSFPSVKSLELQQYYAHPQNNFWKLIFEIKYAQRRDEYLSFSYQKRSKLLLNSGIGLWDIYASCERVGSLDSAIRNAQLSDLDALIKRCPKLEAFAHNGGESYSHSKHTLSLSLPVYKLPSSSPANASWSFEKKLSAWRDAIAPHLT
jgi:hypoxanthine-DNA glycosylase